MGKNAIIFDAEICSLGGIDIRISNIVIVSEGPTKMLNDTAKSTETKCSVSITRSKKNCLGLHYNRRKSF